jgi:DNA-3-methyladenine glycosylase
VRPAATAAPTRLDAAFFSRSVHLVARDLIGCRLFYEGCGGAIVETESYERDDPACHAYAGLTKRTETLFGPPGRAYVYLSYGIHSLLNAVAEPEGEAAAVLIRAIEPTAGLEEMRARRGERPDTDLCSGPGKLTDALGIGLDANGADLTADPFLLLPPEPGWSGEIVTSPRVGITKAVERPWRFSLANSSFVSRPRPESDGPAHPAVIPPPPPDSGAASGAASTSGAASGSGAGSLTSGSGADSLDGSTGT